MDEKTITINAKLCVEANALVDDYFQNHELDFQAIKENVHHNSLLVFSRTNTYNEPEWSKYVISQPLREYFASIHNFLDQKHICTQFVRYYDLQVIERRKEIQELYKEKEEEGDNREKVNNTYRKKSTKRTHTHTHKHVDIIISVVHSISFKLNCKTLTSIRKIWSQ